MLDDIYSVTIKGLIQGQTAESVLHYQVTADADYSALALGLFNHMATSVLPAIANIQSDAFLWDQVTVQKIWPIPAFFPIVTAIGVQGDIATPAMPSEVCFVLTKQTILAGQRYRGRLYISGCANNAISTTTGLWNSTTMGAASSIGATLVANVPSIPSGGVTRPILYHRAAHTVTPINSILPREVPRAQRRRQVGRGI